MKGQIFNENLAIWKSVALFKEGIADLKTYKEEQLLLTSSYLFLE